MCKIYSLMTASHIQLTSIFAINSKPCKCHSYIKIWNIPIRLSEIECKKAPNLTNIRLTFKYILGYSFLLTYFYEDIVCHEFYSLLLLFGPHIFLLRQRKHSLHTRFELSFPQVQRMKKKKWTSLEWVASHQ